MVNLTIDGIAVSVPENTTILDAALKYKIDIPHLCYLKGYNEIGACRLCVVELEGKNRLITSCNNVVAEGMVIRTNSPKVQRDRRNNVELILSQHSNDCVICAKSGNCKLQEISNDLDILHIPFHHEPEPFHWDLRFPLIRDAGKCVKCMRCIQICEKMQSLSVWDLQGTGSLTTVDVREHQDIRDSHCSLCGQCITHCPVGALRERNDTRDFFNAVADPEKIVVVQVAPAIRTAFGESLGIRRENVSIGKIFDALKRMGADYVFDTAFSADLTIMEEATEFLERFESGECREMPMFTSCCPAWVRFCKSEYPQLLSRVSTSKSPQQMFGTVMKTYFAKKIGVNPEKIVTVSIMPCLAKKGEENMELFYGEYAGRDIDVVLTTRELVRLIRASHIRPDTLVNIPGDRPMQEHSGAGLIFGVTGGVMEAALRTAYHEITGENPAPQAFVPIRSKVFLENDGIKECSFQIKDRTIHTAAVSGLGNTRRLLNRLMRKEVHYDFVEVMACPGGCVGGGGQPVHNDEELAFSRGQQLYYLDNHATIRCSHDNEDVRSMYREFFGSPNRGLAHQLLHTEHIRDGKIVKLG